MHLEIFLSVIVRKFFAGLDIAERENKYTTLEDIDLAIRCARMIDEAGGIRRYVPVDHGRLACPKKVLPAILLYLLGCGWASEVFDDACTLRYAFMSEKASATERPTDCKAKGRRYESSLHLGRIPSFIFSQPGRDAAATPGSRRLLHAIDAIVCS